MNRAAIACKAPPSPARVRTTRSFRWRQSGARPAGFEGVRHRRRAHDLRQRSGGDAGSNRKPAGDCPWRAGTRAGSGPSEPDVENRLHHPRHGNRGAGAHRDQQRPTRIGRSRRPVASSSACQALGQQSRRVSPGLASLGSRSCGKASWAGRRRAAREAHAGMRCNPEPWSRRPPRLPGRLVARDGR